jgi:2-oxoglutarate dehydrogenase E2 component (dihydrolipoamide succinyltransferase)
MAVSVVVPAAGDAVTEGRIARWLVKDGSAVKADQVLFELETDKLTVEVPAPAAGVIKLGASDGDVVQVGQEVASIDPSGNPASGSAKPEAPKTESQAVPSPAPAEKPKPKSNDSAVKTSPAAAAAIRDHNLNASDLPASGPGGRVIKDDVLAHLSGEAKPQPAKSENRIAQVAPRVEVVPVNMPRESGVRETRQPMTTIRKRIAERLLESQNTTATLTTFNEADMSAIMDVRSRYNERFEKKFGVKLGFMSVFVKAAVEALKSFPIVNARIDGTDVVMQHFYDIGVAVSTEKGLMVPVLRDVDQMHFADIEKAIADVAKRARDGKVGMADLTGGTFTITNGGIFGSMLSTPILNPPQTAILGMHAIQKRAMVVNDEIVIRPMMYLALSYDHRLLDGREAVQFLVRIKECLEDPERILFGI